MEYIFLYWICKGECLQIKRILITGAYSFIGTSFENWMKQNSAAFSIHTMDVRNDDWKQTDFSKYDVVFHVAAIVHQKEKADMEQLYMRVNCDLTAAVAAKAKEEGVSQFIFISTMNVYGLSSGVITEDTKPNPKTFYGRSKLKAEQELEKLKSDSFHIAVLRPPMVYGKGCKGNYNRLVKLAKNIPVFPDYHNQRSMVNINNLCAFIEKIIHENSSGLFFPQNSEYICTSDMVFDIADSLGRKMHRTKLFNPVIRLMVPRIGIITKIFGDLVYKKDKLIPQK